MHQIIETTDQEKYEMYNSLEKDVIIGMLIEINKHLSRIKPTVRCDYYVSGTDTSMRCIHCGKLKWEHSGQ